MDFNKWEVFVNDDSTRSFLSLEITTSGLSEVCCTTRVTLNVLAFCIYRVRYCTNPHISAFR